MNQINLICLGVNDMQASLAFYRDGLDFYNERKRELTEYCLFQQQRNEAETVPA